MHEGLTLFGLPPHLAMTIVVSVLLCVFAFILRPTLTIVPGKLQSVVELVIDGIAGLANDIMGHKGKGFLPLVLTIFIFVVISNAVGLLPFPGATGITPPTANLNTTLALALIVFVLTHIVGFKEHGIGYVKHFMGPMLVMAPIMFVIEVFGHFARPISLSMRLFGNIFGHELMLGVIIGSLMPYALPLLALTTVLGVLVTVLQAFVFALLTMAYLGGALEEAH